MNVSNCSYIRVSCAALARISIGGKFLLEINKNRGNVLTPLGGALEFLPPAKSFLTDLGADFLKRSDLRLRLPIDNLDSFRAWFKLRLDRESTCHRELYEELVQEHQVEFPPDALKHVEEKYLGLIESSRETTRKDSIGELTHYFIEVFQITLPRIVEDKIVAHLARTGSNLRLHNRDEILAPSHTSDYPFSDTSKEILFI
jgi:hypothetical protein